MAAIHVSTKDYKTGLLNRLFHNDVDSTFNCLRKAAETANESCEQLFGYHNATRRMLAALEERMSAFNGRMYSFDGDVYACRNAMTQTVTVVDKHSTELERLCLDNNQLQNRVMTLEELRKGDCEAEAKNVAILDEVHETVISLGKFKEEVTASLKEFTLRFSEMELERKEQLVKIQTLFRFHEELITELVCVKKAQSNQNGELRAQMTEMAQAVQGLVTHVAVLTSWKEQATRQHERHENILLLCHKLQSNLAEVIATMSQEQQYLFHLSQGMDSKLGLLLEKNGIATPKVEVPSTDTAKPFRDILADMKEIRHAFDKGVK